MNYNPLLLAVPLVLALSACSSDSDYDFETSKAEREAEIAAGSAPEALFNPSTQVVPFPTNLFFLTSTDGTLDLPIGEDDIQTLANPRVALNQSDGFSTTSPIVTSVSESLKADTLQVGNTIRVYEVTTQGGYAVTGIVSEIDNPLFMAALETGNQLVLVPTVPLKPNTNYLVMLTSGITDLDDKPLEAGLLYNLLKGDVALNDPIQEGLRQATGSHVAAAQAFSGIEPDDVALSWVFKTQTIREVLQATKDQTNSSQLVLANSQNNTAAPGLDLQGKADIFVGTLDVPYYQTATGDDVDADVALNSFWKNADGNVVGTFNESGAPDYVPVATGTETIPVIMTVPNANSASQGNMPTDGWPVTIFQHGITGNRTQMLALADAMADGGRVLIAIDMPMHGLISTDSPFHADNTPFAERERTFNVDKVTIDTTTGAPLPIADEQPDPSGQHFYNLQNLANSRDNLRQAVADLWVLSASLSSAAGEGFQLNANDLSFTGHSLGAIAGITMLSYDNSFKAATLAMPGGGIAQLLANSVSFGPVINGALAQNGIATGSAAHSLFLTIAQTLVDSGDPINHATTLASSGATALHMIEVIGDAVIPNSVATAPLSGTDPLVRQLGLTQVDETTSANAVVRFTAGDHGSIIRPTASLEATVEMQRQTVGFAAAQGAQLTITDTSVIEPID